MPEKISVNITVSQLETMTDNQSRSDPPFFSFEKTSQVYDNKNTNPVRHIKCLSEIKKKKRKKRKKKTPLVKVYTRIVTPN